MTPLRQRMVEDMQLRGLSKKTQEAYVRAVRQLAEHYGKSPDRIDEEELRQYFLHAKNDRQACSTLNCPPQSCTASSGCLGPVRCYGSPTAHGVT